MTTEQTFDQALRIFDKQVSEATDFWYTAKTLKHATRSSNHRTSAAMHRTPMFWNTVTHALQSTAIVAVGRVFDNSRGGKKQTIDTLFHFAREHRAVLFSKAALEARKRRHSANVDDWITGYLAHAYVPTEEDFNQLHALVKPHRKTYETQFALIRHKYLAHTAITDQDALDALAAKTSGVDLERLLAFLDQVHSALRDLYDNGRAPRLRPGPYLPARSARLACAEARRCLRLVTAAATK